MAEAQRLEAVRYRIESLLQLVIDGKIRIPDFQRGLRWTNRDVLRLFDSLYKGYPIGTLLFWQRPAEASIVHLGPVRVDAPGTSEASWVVDGQQRLTALAAALLPSEPGRTDNRFEVSFDLEREQFYPTRDGDADTRIPVRGAFDLQSVLAWVRDRRLDERHQERAFQLADRLRNYEIPAYRVDAEDEQALREIFDRTNTFGKRMTKAEVFRALNTSADPDADLSSLADDIASRGFGSLEGNTLVYCILATRGPDVLRDFHHEFSSPEDTITAFQATSAAIGRTMTFLKSEADVPHFDLVAYQHQVVALVRFFALHPEPEDQTLTLLRRWFWQAAEVGPLPKLGSTGTLRAACTAIVPGNEHGSVRSLLEHFDVAAPQFDLGNYRWTASSTRIAVCALARQRPMAFRDGEPLDVTELIDLAGRDSLRPLVERSSSPDELTLANRVFVDPADQASDSELTSVLLSASEEVLASHLISPALHALLAEGAGAEFLAQRRLLVVHATQQFLDARTERNIAIRPSIAQLVLNV